MTWACKLDLEGTPSREELPHGRRAIAYLYVKALPDGDPRPAIDEACDALGFACVGVEEVIEVPEEEVPEEARACYGALGAGLGVLHTYPFPEPGVSPE